MAFTNKNGDVSLGSILSAMQNIQDATAMSLFQYTQQATVNSRVFVDQKVANEPILGPVLSTQMNLYAGLILTALSMNNYITSTKRVRDMMDIVSTESFTPCITTRDLLKKFAGIEDFSHPFGKRLEGIVADDQAAATGQSAEDEKSSPDDDKTEEAVTDAETSDAVDGAEAPPTADEVEIDDESQDDQKQMKSGRPKDLLHFFQSKMWDTDWDAEHNGDDDLIEYGTTDGGYSKDQDKMTDVPLPSGRLLDIGMTSESGAKIHFNLVLNFNPTFIPPDVAQQFLSLNFTPTVKQRWLQMRAGEISTIKDFIFGMDLRRKRLEALKHDKSGALKDMIDRQENSRSNAWLKLFQIQPNKMNIANTILVFDKYNFDMACSNVGLRFNDFNNRQSFFNKALAMMVITIDPMYNKVEIFYHGMKNYSQFTFDQVKKASKSDSVTDLMQVMKNYASGMAPKF